MLLSMTGFGDARRQDDRLCVAAEVRSVNNRYLKVVTKCPDAYSALESEIEKVVREHISRGTVNVALRIENLAVDSEYRLNQRVLERYWRQLGELEQRLHAAGPTDVGSLLLLPGAVSEQTPANVDASQDWPAIREVLVAAIEKLQTYRRSEGESMQRELAALCSGLSAELERVSELAPQVVSNYRNRLHERVRELLEGLNASVDPSDLIREVSIYSDRCDVNEEITRLKSHLDHFRAFLGQEKSQGRKLEFLSQEIFREINTIGAKANDVSIAHCVVEMKSTIEKVREILQNVE